MSVVAAKVYEDKIIIAADSIVVSGWAKDTKGNFVKLAKINDMILGGCGTCEEQSIMWHYMKTHKPSSNEERAILDFIIEFVTWKKSLTELAMLENDYILAFQGKLFCIKGMFVQPVKDYCAIGAGDNYATCALYLGHSPKEAVKAACDLSCLVAEPILEETMAIN